MPPPPTAREERYAHAGVFGTRPNLYGARYLDYYIRHGCDTSPASPEHRQRCDPHSPRDGGLWSHIGWILTGRTMNDYSAVLLPYVPNLRKDKFHVWISRWHWVPSAALGALLFVAGGWPYLLWGFCFRTVIGLQSTWLVNSATHMWGSRCFTTADSSKNSLWVALLTFGEGWHNNHHAHPQSSRHGLAWFEFDPNWYGISAY